MRNTLISIAVFIVLVVACIDAANIKREFLKKNEKIVNSKPQDVKYVHMRNNGFLKVSDVSPNDDWIARGWIILGDFNSTGWYILEIETNPDFNDTTQAFGAGYLEGDLTQDLISMMITNMVGTQCDDPSDEQCLKLKAWLNQNFDWMLSQIDANPADPYWHQVSLTLQQFYGLANAYYDNSTQLKLLSLREFFRTIIEQPDYFKLLALQLGGDLFELLSVIQGTVDPFYAGSCSALVKVLDSNEDIFISHVTWSEFNMMLRILKHYKFHFHLNDQDDTEVPGYELTFSSYPGIIVSIDDFYVSSANMAIIETTIGNSNADLWKYVTPETNLYWIRVGVANRLASSGPDWARTFAMFNSGTYNNEWMILDYKLFTPGEPLRNNLFIVLEQLPGQVEWADMTDVLRKKSFWSSYNIPFFPDIYNISGYYDNYLKYGDIFSYQNTARAKIFNRDAGNVKNMDDMIRMMRYNNFTADPFSKCECVPPYSSELTISARSDLNPANGTYPIDMLGHRQHGATDMKVTSFSMARKRDFIAICGPTYNADITPFVWSESDFDKKVSHIGMPDRFEFPPFLTKWYM